MWGCALNSSDPFESVAAGVAFPGYCEGCGRELDVWDVGLHLLMTLGRLDNLNVSCGGRVCLDDGDLFCDVDLVWLWVWSTVVLGIGSGCAVADRLMNRASGSPF